jgi:hypothetical protein
MANALSALNPEIWKPMVQDYLNKMLVAKEVANTKCEAYLSSGDQVNFPYVSDVRVQSYTQGTDLTMDDLTAVQSSLVVNQSKAATFILDPVQEKQALADYGADLAYQSAFQLRNNIDQTTMSTGINGANGTVAGGTLSTSTVLSNINNAYTELVRQNAVDGKMFGVIDAHTATLLTETFVANGFQEADMTLRNQFRGKAAGFDMYVSNNLPTSVVLTVDTQPANTDTFTILGVTWTCVTDGTAAVAGEINIGANIADFKAIFLTAINGTTPPAVNDYIDVSAEDRRKMQNAQLAAGAWATHDCKLTAYGKIGGSETFTTITNVFGTETGSMLFGKKGAISMAIQMQPELYVREEPKQLAKNYITHTLYGTKVFTRDAFRLVKMTHNVQ